MLDMLPPQMAAVTSGDAGYHFNQRETWIESTQLNTLRNLNFHDRIASKVAESAGGDAVILELGGGVGYDAELFFSKGKPFRCYIFSEISTDLVSYVEKRLRSQRPIVFCSLDANDVLIADNQIDVVYIVAAVHHFPDLPRTIREIDRFTKSNARVIFGLEPNRLWSQLLRYLRPLYRPLFAKKEHSPADEEIEGFTIGDFHKIAEDARWRLVEIEPAWFFCGFLHFGLEATYRLFGLRKRIVLPASIEKGVLLLDRIFFMIPFTRHLAWSYTVTFEKAKPGLRAS